MTAQRQERMLRTSSHGPRATGQPELPQVVRKQPAQHPGGGGTEEEQNGEEGQEVDDGVGRIPEIPTHPARERESYDPRRESSQHRDEHVGQEADHEDAPDWKRDAEHEPA